LVFVVVFLVFFEEDRLRAFGFRPTRLVVVVVEEGFLLVESFFPVFVVFVVFFFVGDLDLGGDGEDFLLDVFDLNLEEGESDLDDEEDLEVDLEVLNEDEEGDFDLEVLDEDEGDVDLDEDEEGDFDLEDLEGDLDEEGDFDLDDEGDLDEEGDFDLDDEGDFDLDDEGDFDLLGVGDLDLDRDDFVFFSVVVVGRESL